MPSRAKSIPSTRALWLIPLAAILAILPLILHGNSCGHDQVFHIQGWIDAAQQLRHGHYPRWSFTSAWNAGEPRFLFYPPLSWLLGAALTLIFPPALTPTIFVFIALLLAGLTFHHFASHFATPNAALLASAIYLANPYMLFNAFERTAYAELLAAAWIPLLLLAILRPRPTVRGTALPIALLWLTNAPAAVMGCYALALLATLRFLVSIIATTRQPSPSAQAALKSPESPAPTASSAPTTSSAPTASSAPTTSSAPTASSAPATIGYPEASASGLTSPQKSRGFSPWGMLYPTAPASPLRLALTYIAGTLLGLALPAFYLIPAAYERRFVQVTMAIIPGMRPQDNFLFAHTADSGHNGVNLQISLLALTLIALTFAALITLLLRTYLQKPGAPFMPRLHRVMSGMTALHPTSQTSTLSAEPTTQQNSVISNEPATRQNSVISTGARSAQWRDLQLCLTLTFLAAVITFLLFPPSTLLWLHVPDLAFLQLPWRLLTLLTPVLALTIALLLSPRAVHLPPSAQDRGMSGLATIFTQTAALLLPLALGFTAFHLYSQFNPPDDSPAAIAQHLATHHGFPPTDEYTPNRADNDILRTDNPAYWLLPNLPNGQPADPNTPAPNTTPTATELDPTIDSDDTPIPLSQTLSTEAPTHLSLNLPQPATLVLNLRDYPNWVISDTDDSFLSIDHPPHIQRDDGLLAIAVASGNSNIDITWRRTPDQTLGLAISALALLTLALTFRGRQR